VARGILRHSAELRAIHLDTQFHDSKRPAPVAISPCHSRATDATLSTLS